MGGAGIGDEPVRGRDVVLVERGEGLLERRRSTSTGPRAHLGERCPPRRRPGDLRTDRSQLPGARRVPGSGASADLGGGARTVERRERPTDATGQAVELADRRRRPRSGSVREARRRSRRGPCRPAPARGRGRGRSASSTSAASATSRAVEDERAGRECRPRDRDRRRRGAGRAPPSRPATARSARVPIMGRWTSPPRSARCRRRSSTSTSTDPFVPRRPSSWRREIGLSLDLAEARRRMIGPERCADQAELLTYFDLPIALLQTADALRRVTEELDRRPRRRRDPIRGGALGAAPPPRARPRRARRARGRGAVPCRRARRPSGPPCRSSA